MGHIKRQFFCPLGIGQWLWILNSEVWYDFHFGLDQVGHPVPFPVLNLHCSKPDQVSEDVAELALKSRPVAVGKWVGSSVA